MEKLAEGYGLVEGPLWDATRGLIFSDVLFGGVFSLGKDGKVGTVFEHRRGIGGISAHVAGALPVRRGIAVMRKPSANAGSSNICPRRKRK